MSTRFIDPSVLQDASYLHRARPRRSLVKQANKQVLRTLHSLSIPAVLAFSAHHSLATEPHSMHWTLLALLAAASARKPLSPSPRTPRHLSKQRARLDINGGASDAVATPTSLSELQLLCEKEEGVCVVDFGATWCGPCQRIAPVFDQLAEGCPDALFAKVDVDEVPDASQHYSVSALPTFLVFKDGKEVARIQGADEAGLRAALDKAGCPPPKNDIF